MNAIEDERTVALLKRLADDGAPRDRWLPDGDAVTRRGHHLRLRRTTTAAGSGVLVLALVIGVPTTLAGRGILWRDGVAPATEGPSPVATSSDPSRSDDGEVTAPPVTVLAPGIAAVSREPSHLMGLTDAEGTPSEIWYSVGTWGDIDLSLHLAYPDLTGFSAVATHGAIGELAPPPDFADEPLLDAPFAQSSTLFPGGEDGTVWAGVTPTGAPHAFLVSSGAGFDLGDGTRTNVLEVPTFSPPTPAKRHLEADQRLYVLALTPPAATGDPAATMSVVFGADDGTVTDPQCVQDAAQYCPSGSSAAADAVAAFLAGASGAPTSSAATDPR